MDSNYKKNIFLEFNCSHNLMESDLISWSLDNCISFITEKGVYIFNCNLDLLDSSKCIFSQKYFIENPKNFFNCQIDINMSKVKSPPNQAHQELILTYNEMIIKLNNDQTFLKYKLAKWSPFTEQFGCFLSLLTYDHQIIIFYHQSNEWVMLKNVSDLLLSRVKYDLNQKQTHLQLGEKLRQISVTSLTWSKVEKENGQDSCYLICGTKSGYLYFFKLVIIKNKPEIILQNSWFTNMGSIISLSWFKENLIICPSNGQVILITINLNCLNVASNEIGIAPRVYAWKEIDEAGVYYLVCRDEAENNFYVIFAKSTFIIVSYIQEKIVARKKILLVSNVTVTNSLYDMSCTGLALLNSSKFIITSFNCMIEAELTSSNISQKILEKDGFDFYNLSLFGITTSPNYALTCSVQTMSKFYDHLFLKEPSKLRIFPNYDFDSLKKKIEDILMQGSQGSNQSSSLREYSDFLQCLRGYFLAGNRWIPSALQEALDQQSLWSPKSSTIVFMKMLRFIALTIIHFGSSKELESFNQSLEKIIDLLEDYIMKAHIETIYSTLNRSQISSNQKISLYNFNIWMKNRFQVIGSDDLRYQIEKCPICLKNIEFSNRKSDQCSNGHEFGRCVNSLIVCDFGNNKFEKCQKCKRCLFIVPIVWKISWKCLFCS